MAVVVKTYRITWSSRGERADEEPITVAAFTYLVEGDFFSFYSQNPAYDSPILQVRMSDVREIRRAGEDG